MKIYSLKLRLYTATFKAQTCCNPSLAQACLFSNLVLNGLRRVCSRKLKQDLKLVSSLPLGWRQVRSRVGNTEQCCSGGLQPSSPP